MISGAWGTGVLAELSQGGCIDPGSESAEVSQIVTDNFGRQNPDILAIYTVPGGQTLADVGPAVTAALDRFRAEVPTESMTEIGGVTSALAGGSVVGVSLLFVFPQAAIRSLGFGAIAAVTGAAVLSLMAVPALQRNTPAHHPRP